MFNKKKTSFERPSVFKDHIWIAKQRIFQDGFHFTNLFQTQNFLATSIYHLLSEINQKPQFDLRCLLNCLATCSVYR